MNLKQLEAFVNVAEKQLKREGIDIRKLNVVANMENTEVIKQSVKKGLV